MHRRLILAFLLTCGLAQARAGLVEAQAPTVERQLARLTLTEKAAQLIMVWVDGSPVTRDNDAFQRVVQLVDSLGVGGLVMSRGAYGNVARKLNLLQRRARVPLLVASDLEGGTAFRIRGGTGFPTNMGVGASGSEEVAYDMGRIIAEEGRALGIHLTFSPVVDVNNNPENPIINTRSFGGDPELVARLAVAQIRGTQDHGMLATAKHFPGHGNTSTDSHLALPVLEQGWPALSSLELIPFRASIEAGVEVVMSAHIALPGLDSGRTRPATMITEILTGILRDSLGFQGLVVTDALDMGGVVAGYGPEEAAVQALLAGSDVLLMPTDPVAAVRALTRAVEGGRVTMSRLDRSVRRILTVKERMGLFKNALVPEEAIEAVFSRASSERAAESASTRALVLVKDSLGVLDSLRSGPRSIALVTYGEANSGTVGRTIAAELGQRGFASTRFALSPSSSQAAYDSARRVVSSEVIRLFVVSIRALESKGRLGTPAPLASLLSEVASDGQTLVIALGSPYVLSHVPDLPGYLVGWQSNPSVERAVADALTGGPITGRLPVEIPPAWPIGWGIQVPRQR